MPAPLPTNVSTSKSRPPAPPAMAKKKAPEMRKPPDNKMKSKLMPPPPPAAAMKKQTPGLVKPTGNGKTGMYFINIFSLLLLSFLYIY